MLLPHSVRNRNVFGCAGSELARGEDRRGRASDDCFGDAAQQIAVVSVAAARARDDEVGVDGLGVVADLDSGSPLADLGNDVVDSIAQRAECLVTLLFEGVADVLADALWGGRDVALVEDVDGVDFGVESVGEVQRERDGPLGAGRPVRRQDDCVEHMGHYSRSVHKRAEPERCSVAFCHRRTESPAMTVEIETVLVPVDGTEKAKRAVEYAITVAERYDASVHVLHVIDEEVARGVRQGDIDAEAIAANHQAFFEEAVQTVEDHGVDVTSSAAAGFSATKLSTHPVSVVLDTATNIGADFIVVPRESVREDPNAMLGKVAQYVLSYASQPVLSV